MERMWLPGSAREQGALSGEDPAVKVLADIGLFETGKKFRFRCAICGNVVVNDQRMSPACTGPSWTNDHPLEPMEEIPHD